MSRTEAAIRGMLVGALGWAVFALAELATGFLANPVPYGAIILAKLLGAGLAAYLVIGALVGGWVGLSGALLRDRGLREKASSWHFAWTLGGLLALASGWVIKKFFYRGGFSLLLVTACLAGALGVFVFFRLSRKLLKTQKSHLRRSLAFITGCVTMPVLVFGGAELNRRYLPAKTDPISLLWSFAYLLATLVAAIVFYWSLVLVAWVGRQIWGYFCRASRLAVFALLLGVVWVALTTLLVARSPKPTVRSTARNGVNVVLITLDALRTGHLGCYGYNRQTSPNIDEFAKSATRFTQAIVQCPSTKGSVTSILSGQLVAEHGMREHYQVLPEEVVLLPQMLRRRGYDTAGFVWSQFLTPAMGYAHRFDCYDAFVPVPYSRLCGLRMLDALGLWPAHAQYASADRVTRRALDWLETARQPFFLYLHYKEPHYPYQAPESYQRWSAPGQTPLSPFIVFQRIAANPDYVHSPEFKQEWRHITDAYDACIRYGDHKVGEVLSALKAMGLYQEALIILSADHGEEFLEHGIGMHRWFLYDEVIKVPLLVKLPKSFAQAQPLVSALVRSVDIAPTILEVCELETPGMAGRSFLGLTLGQSEQRPRLSFSESWDGSKVAVRSAGYKYIWQSTGAELYDLKNDPGERENIISKDVAELPFLRRQLNWYLQLAAKPRRPRTLRPDEETVEQLRSLGYLEAPPDAENPAPGVTEPPEPGRE